MQGVLEAPKRVGCSWADQKYLHIAENQPLWLHCHSAPLCPLLQGVFGFVSMFNPGAINAASLHKPD
jgi:hypothetical protein